LRPDLLAHAHAEKIREDSMSGVRYSGLPHLLAALQMAASKRPAA
jgi:hypothetical protein